jgi:hypothetical protein
VSIAAESGGHAWWAYTPRIAGESVSESFRPVTSGFEQSKASPDAVGGVTKPRRKQKAKPRLEGIEEVRSEDATEMPLEITMGYEEVDDAAAQVRPAENEIPLSLVGGAAEPDSRQSDDLVFDDRVADDESSAPFARALQSIGDGLNFGGAITAFETSLDSASRAIVETLGEQSAGSSQDNAEQSSASTQDVVLQFSGAMLQPPDPAAWVQASVEQTRVCSGEMRTAIASI